MATTAPIDFTTEHALSLSQAARIAPGRGSAHLHPSTLTRWILRGCRTPGGRRVYLRAARVGSRWMVSRESLDEFFTALTVQTAQPANGTPPAPRTAGQRRRAAERAARELDRMGI
jgi:hypothetical protein